MNRLLITFFILMAGAAAQSGAADCNTLMSNASLSDAERREQTAVCLRAYCEEEAQALQLTEEAGARFMNLCLVDRYDLVVGGTLQATDSAHAALEENTITCVGTSDCTDLSTDVEATALGPSGSSRAESGHRFVRVKRIEETLDP